MRTIISILLVLVICGLAYVLVDSIREPIIFKNEKEKRDTRVENRLKEIRNSQEMYRSIKGEFAKNFDDLTSVLKNDDFSITSIIGNPDDPGFDLNNLKYDTIFKPAIDSVRSLSINLDSLRYVPYGAGAKFNMTADTITYQKTLTHVLECGVSRAKYMGKYADDFYKQYDDRYFPNEIIKFGDLSNPTLAGNWE